MLTDVEFLSFVNQFFCVDLTIPLHLAVELIVVPLHVFVEESLRCEADAVYTRRTGEDLNLGRLGPHF